MISFLYCSIIFQFVLVILSFGVVTKFSKNEFCDFLIRFIKGPVFLYRVFLGASLHFTFAQYFSVICVLIIMLSIFNNLSIATVLVVSKMISLAYIIVVSVTVVQRYSFVAMERAFCYTLCLIQFVYSIMPCRFLFQVIYDIKVSPRYFNVLNFILCSSILILFKSNGSVRVRYRFSYFSSSFCAICFYLLFGFFRII